MRNGGVRFGILLVGWCIAQPAAAFCGSMIPRAEGRTLVSDASMVVLAREGDHTVLTMRNDYRGPPEDFALVIPVPSEIAASDVRTLDANVLEAMDRLTAPALYEYFERDPCWNPNFATPPSDRELGRSAGYGMAGLGRGHAGGVDVESRFAVDEYDMAVLSASDSTGLERWLGRRGYRVPDGFADAVRPYVEQGYRFLVGRIAADRLTLEDGRAVLSPIRVHFRSEQFSLPIRLGQLNSSGTQDLVVHIIARDTRYDVASHPHTTIPTHYRVDASVRPRFDAFYEALFAETLEQHPGAVVTEWAGEIRGLGGATALEPDDLYALAGPFMNAPGTVLGRTRPLDVDALSLELQHVDASDARTLLRLRSNGLRYCYERTTPNGSDVTIEMAISTDGAAQRVSVTGESDDVTTCLRGMLRRWQFRPGTEGEERSLRMELPSPLRSTTEPGPETEVVWDPDTTLVATRLHYRYGRSPTDDLVFRPADPITGGTYTGARGNDGPWMVRAARPFSRNWFEARYFIGHPWEGPISCGASAVRDSWVPGWRDGREQIGPYAGFDEAGETLEAPTGPVVLEDAFLERVPELRITPHSPPVHEREAPPTELVPVGSPTAEAARPDGCGCRVTGGDRTPVGLLVLALLGLLRRRRG